MTCGGGDLTFSVEPLPTPPASPEAHAAIDSLEQQMMKHPALECPLRHTFTPGMYSRQIFMPAGAIITSKIHKTEHQFIVSKGRLDVWIDKRGWIEISAPYAGITYPGTRRVLVVYEDTIWTTFHPTTKTTVKEVEAEIIEPRREHLGGLTQPSLAEMYARLIADQGANS